MKTNRFAILSFTAVVFLVACSQTCVVSAFTSQRRDWNFIESVGGMKVELGQKRLEVASDVSGTKMITYKPRLVTSALGVRKLQCKRPDYSIQRSVVTSLSVLGISIECGSIDLSGYPAGHYSVVYLNPDGTTHPLGSIYLR